MWFVVGAAMVFGRLLNQEPCEGTIGSTLDMVFRYAPRTSGYLKALLVGARQGKTPM